jgi:cellulose biosynthesis protein BcsQ
MVIVSHSNRWLFETFDQVSFFVRFFIMTIYRNEAEVESKFVVGELLPALGFKPEQWFQEVALGRIRLDFLAFGKKNGVDTSSYQLLIEAKAPQVDLDKAELQLKRYMDNIHLRLGILTNGIDLRLYERSSAFVIERKLSVPVTAWQDHLDVIKSYLGPTQTNDSKFKPSISTTPYDLIETTPTKATTIAIYHNKGGVGKTTTVVNLAAALADKQQRVLIIDLDSQANSTFATGFLNTQEENLVYAHIGLALQSEAHYPLIDIIKDTNYHTKKIDIIPSHIDMMSLELYLHQMDSAQLLLRNKIKAIEHLYDFILIDTPPALNLFARMALIAADGLLIPSDLKPFANQGLSNVLLLLEQVNTFRRQIKEPELASLGIVPVKILPNHQFLNTTFKKRKQELKQWGVFEILETIIYERDELNKAAEFFDSPVSVSRLKSDSLSAKEFDLLAEEILTKTIEKLPLRSRQTV